MFSPAKKQILLRRQKDCGNVDTHFSTKGSAFMARPGPQTQAKRRREQAKKEKRRAKEEKKALRKAQKEADAT